MVVQHSTRLMKLSTDTEAICKTDILTDTSIPSQLSSSGAHKHLIHVALFATTSTAGNSTVQGPYSPNGKKSYHSILWSLEATRLDAIMIVPLWNLTGISAAACQNSERLKTSKTEPSAFETSRAFAVRLPTALVNRGPVSVETITQSFIRG